jgi:hypothetical protein
VVVVASVSGVAVRLILRTPSHALICQQAMRATPASQVVER